MFGVFARADSQWKFGRFYAVGGEMPDGFAINIHAERSEINVDAPHWFLVLFCALLAALPWTPSVFGVRSFSLRTLFIAFSVLAMLLGFIGWLMR
jgi:hypothetical protein